MLKLVACLLISAAVSLADEARYSICFEQYLESSTNSSSAYVENYKKCFSQHNKEEEQAFNITNKRGSITERASTLCERIRSCDATASDLGFFQCNRANELQNLNDLVWINFNSRSAMIDLQNQNSEAEKEVLQCTVDTQQKFLVDTKNAYEDLMLCLQS